MNWASIKLLSAQAALEPVHGCIFAQMTQKCEKQTKNGKPYWELQFADVSSSMTIKIWDNAPCYEQVCALQQEECLALTGHWQQNAFGLDVSQLSMRPLTPEESELLFAGDAELIAKQERDWQLIADKLDSIRDPRLNQLCALTIKLYGERYRRAAAARGYHHARRGGLVEHVAGMIRAAEGICTAYPQLNRDLLLAGAFFHDCGKMWENNYNERSLSMPYSEIGELMGHIPMGIELINSLWKQIMELPEAAGWAKLHPSTHQVRFHLLHLIASHHGELAFGSPVVPKTPEAIALHYIDNLDAKLEMFIGCYESSPELGPHVYQRKAPLPSNIVSPLPAFEVAGEKPE
ncbi:MAG: HD domain-containing protein [Akkermansia sp.]